MIDEGPQQDELAGRNSRCRCKCEATHRRIEHPIRDLVRATIWLPDQEMVDPSCSGAPITKTVWPDSG